MMLFPGRRSFILAVLALGVVVMSVVSMNFRQRLITKSTGGEITPQLPLGYDSRAIAEAMQLLAEIAESSSSTTSVSSSRRYLTGLATFQSNREKSLSLISQASDAGCVEAGYTLGRYYLEQGEKDRYAFALSHIRNAADHGIVQAQLDYGIILLDRTTGHYDPSDGLEWLQRAAESGREAAVEIYVERLAARGGSVEIDELAFLEVEKLANAGNDTARCIVAESLINTDQLDEAREILETAVNSGHSTAQFLMAIHFLDPGDPNRQELLEKAADGGNCFAALELYQDFRWNLSDTTPDSEIEQAVDRLATVVDQMQDLAYTENPQYMYLYGVAVESLETKATTESIEWIRRAAGAGYPDAIISNALHDLASPDPIVQETGLFALRRLARQGDVSAQLELGRLLVDESRQSLISEGVSWLEAASLAGDFEAAELLSVAVENGVAVPIFSDDEVTDEDQGN